MPDTIYKILENCEVKKVGERQYEFTASTSTQDRDGEVIDATGWDLKNFKKNPVIMYAHDYRSLPIGKASRVWLHNGSLKNTVEFPPEGTYEFADIVERLVDTGYLKTESVGFIPKKWEDGDGEKAPRRTYTKQELLEISIVPVPSNPDALRNAVKEGVITTKQFESLTEGEPEIIEDKVTKPEETDEFIRIPVRTCDVTATIDISKKEGISALYCGKEKQVRTYLFRKDKGWTMAKAKEWVKEHDGKSFEPHEVSQSEIIDEIDYLKTLIEQEGMNDLTLKAIGGLVKSTWGELVKMDMGKMQEMHDMMASAETMAKKSKKMAEDMMAENEDMKRISGSDIPVEDISHVPMAQRVSPLPEKAGVESSDILESIKRIGGK